MNFIHKWLHPHCPHCMELARESKVCDSCEILKLEVARLRQDNERMLNRLLTRDDISPEPKTETELKPINPSKFMSWRVKREMLERESRDAAIKLRNKVRETESSVEDKQSIEELEKELGVNNASTEV